MKSQCPKYRRGSHLVLRREHSLVIAEKQCQYSFIKKFEKFDSSTSKGSVLFFSHGILPLLDTIYMPFDHVAGT